MCEIAAPCACLSLANIQVDANRDIAHGEELSNLIAIVGHDLAALHNRRASER